MSICYYKQAIMVHLQVAKGCQHFLLVHILKVIWINIVFFTVLFDFIYIQNTYVMKKTTSHYQLANVFMIMKKHISESS